MGLFDWLFGPEDVERLARLGAVPRLARLLRHPDPELRGKVATALGSVRPVEAVEALRDGLADVDTEVRLKVVNALAARSETSALDALYDSLFRETDARVQSLIAECLIPTRSERSADAMVQLTKSANPALRSIGVRGASRIVASCRIVGASESDDAIRYGATSIRLGSGDGRYVIWEKFLDPVVNAIVTALFDTETRVVELAQEAFGIKDKAGPITALLNILESEGERIDGWERWREQKIRDAAWRLLAQRPEAPEVIVELLGRTDAHVHFRCHVISVAGQLGGTQIEAALSRLLHDTTVREAAIGALVRMRSPLAVEPLIEDWRNETRDSAKSEMARQFGMLRDQRAIGLLIEAIPLGSQAVIWALGELGDQRAAKPLAEQFRKYFVPHDGYDEGVTLNYLAALAKIGGPDVSDILDWHQKHFPQRLALVRERLKADKRARRG